MIQEYVWVIGADRKITPATSDQIEKIKQQRSIEKYDARIRAAEDIMRCIRHKIHVSNLNKMIGNSGEENEPRI